MMQTRRPRHRASVIALLAVALGVLAQAIPASASAGGSARAVSGGPVTAAAPRAGDGATVTVSRTTGLVNQTLEVSWAGFEPSSASRLANSGDSLDVNTENPVRVYECRGAAPASSSDCYGAPGYRGQDATATSPAIAAVQPFTYAGQTNAFDATPDGPANWQDNVTRADGTGQVTIQVFTQRESAALGCDNGSACSIVVVPNYGRPQGDTEDLMDAPWAWARRTVVPLSFLPVDDACPLSGTSLRVEGSPIAADLLATWRGATCTLAVDAATGESTALGEPERRGAARRRRGRGPAGPRRRRRGHDRHRRCHRPPARRRRQVRRRRLRAGQRDRPGRGLPDRRRAPPAPRRPDRRRPRPPRHPAAPQRPRGRQGDRRVVPLGWRPGRRE